MIAMLLSGVRSRRASAMTPRPMLIFITLLVGCAVSMLLASAFVSPSGDVVRAPSAVAPTTRMRGLDSHGATLPRPPPTAASKRDMPSCSVMPALAVAFGAIGAAVVRQRGRCREVRRLRATMQRDSGGSGTFPPTNTPLLDSLNDAGPQGLKLMDIDQLKQLAEEVRWQVLDAVSATGGHLGASLGVVELTVALHAVFNTPEDEICWDVAHQVYPHKVLTGRRGRIYSLRQSGGLSGFTKRAESPYDSFGAGHSSTSISAAVGFETARDLQGRKGHSVAVIGDGAITGGMAYEAMNHAGGVGSKVIVILNDNGQVSLPTFYNSVTEPVGALASSLAKSSSGSGLRIQGDIARIETSEAFQEARQMVKAAAKAKLPKRWLNAAAKLDEYVRDFIKTVPFEGSGAGARGEFFEQLGFYYTGPVDGHDLGTLVEVLSNLKADHEQGRVTKPILLHIKTSKGKGYPAAEEARDRLHAVQPKFNVKQPSSSSGGGEKLVSASPVALTTIFGEALVNEGNRDPSIVAITAAMPEGTGVSIFEKRFGPSRTFDVAIAEQHAVTFAAALAAGGLRPFCCIYSTFLQRGYDQVVHDVAVQNLPVRFVLDRAGLVGLDGPTHVGAFDLSYLGCVPNLRICAPSDEVELVHMTHTLAMLDDGPSAMRYPRGAGYGDMELPSQPEFLEPGKGRIVREGKNGTLAILSIGTRLREALQAAKRLESCGISATVADARWAKPLDHGLLCQLASEHRALVTIEENAIGGFSAQVAQALLEDGFLDGSKTSPLVLRSMILPDHFIEHDTPANQHAEAELNATHIVAKAVSALSRAGVSVETSPPTGGE